jgi:putative hemolysin
MLKSLLSRLLGLTQLDAAYEMSRRIHVPDIETMMQTVTRALDLRLIVSREELQRIPTEGPVILIANHPTGALEGIALAALLDRIRPDNRTVSHAWFGRYPSIAETMFLIEPDDSRAAITGNVKALRKAIDWVNKGSLLTLYPAGEVARFDLRTWTVRDPAWQNGIARILKATRATVVPVHIEGRNSLLFYLMSLVHPRLGALMLIRELFKKQGQQVRVRIGNPIAFKAAPTTGRIQDTVEFLRRSVDALVASRPPSAQLTSRERKMPSRHESNVLPSAL